jgi:hypothetical protein
VQEGVADGLISGGVLKGSPATVGEAINRVGGMYRGACVTVRVTGAGGYPLQAANAPGRKISQPSASTANLNGKPVRFIPYEGELNFILGDFGAFFLHPIQGQENFSAHGLVANRQLDFVRQSGVQAQVILGVLAALTQAQVPVGEE